MGITIKAGDKAKPAETRCKCRSHSTLTSWWWAMCWLGTLAYCWVTSATLQTAGTVAFTIFAILTYFFWPIFLLIDLAETVLLLRAIGAALGVSV